MGQLSGYGNMGDGGAGGGIILLCAEWFREPDLWSGRTIRLLAAAAATCSCALTRLPQLDTAANFFGSFGGIFDRAEGRFQSLTATAFVSDRRNRV